MSGQEGARGWSVDRSIDCSRLAQSAHLSLLFLLLLLLFSLSASSAQAAFVVADHCHLHLLNYQHHRRNLLNRE